MISEDYVSFETAKLLKEKGFDVNTFAKYAGKEGVTEEWYDDYRERMIKFDWEDGHLIEPLTEPQSQYRVYGDTVPAPTLQMVMKWLRKIHNLEIYPYHNSPNNRHNSEWWFEIIKYPNSVAEYESGFDEEVDTYEKACESAIKYCLENLI